MQSQSELSHNLIAIFRDFDNLITPTESILSLEETPADWLNNVLKEKLPASDVTSETGTDVRWIYVKRCLKLLSDLKDVLVKLASNYQQPLPPDGIPPLSPDTLSVAQQQKVATIIQLVIAMGVVPYLLTGIGVPAQQRSKFLQHLLETVIDIPVQEKYERLCHVATSLTGLLSHKGLSQILITRNLDDILAAHIQLGYAPLKKPSVCEKVNDNFVMTQELFDKFSEDQIFFRSQLNSIISRVYPPLAVRNLLILQSIGAGERVRPAPKSINKTRSPTPKWLQAACGSLLSELLTQKDGVLNVIRGVLDTSFETSDPQKFHVIAKVIASPPSTGEFSGLEPYFQLVCPQILNLLSVEGNTNFHLIAASCIRLLAEKSSSLTTKYLLSKVFNPLLKLCDQVEVLDQEKQEIVSETELGKCIQWLHILFVIANDPSLNFIEQLQPVILPLLELHCQISNGVSNLRSMVGDLVKSFIDKSPLSSSLKTLRAFSFQLETEEMKLRLMNSATFGFAPGELGGTRVVQKEQSQNDSDNSTQLDTDFIHDDERSLAVVDLLLGAPDLIVAIEFYLSLLKDLNEMMTGEILSDAEAEIEVSPTVESQSLGHTFDADLENTMKRLRYRLMIVRLFGLLSENEKLRSELTKTPQTLIEFLAITLRRCGKLCSKQNKEKSNEFPNLEVQSLTTVLSLLSCLVVSDSFKTSDWNSVQKLVDDLKILSQNHFDSNVKQMSEKLQQVIVTHGAVLKEPDELRNLHERVFEDSPVESKTSKLQGTNYCKDEQVTYQSAQNFIQDDEIPVKGHGLIVLTKLVSNKDVETLKNIDAVIKTFQDNLVHDDTYIYLQSIFGLAECSHFSPDIIIDQLTKEFALLDDKEFTEEKGIEIRTKIGEALVRVTRILGELTPAHRNKLINPFFAQLSHPDPLVRASSLSNLGEVCKNLRFALGSLASDIFSNLNEILRLDKSLEVRRAAVMVITMILQGLGADAIRVLESVLRDIWRALVSLRNTEQDGPMLFHVGQAIDEVDKIVKKLFQPEQQLKKIIYVLDEPPNLF